MRLTDEQFKVLSQYEPQFRTAVKSRWARFPGTAAIRQIHDIKTEVTGIRSSLNTSCSTCVLRLLTDMGNIYFDEKARREEQRVQASQEDVQPQEKVEVKTAKPKRVRKPKEQK